MSVLQRKELEESPLADLHAIASELGIEGFRGLRRDDLIGAIIKAQGGEDDGGAADSSESDADAGEESEDRPRRRRSRGGRGRGGRGGRDRDRDEDSGGQADEEDDSDSSDADDTSDQPVVEGVLDILSNGSGFLRGPEDEVYVSQAQIKRCELRAGDMVSGRLRPARRNERHPSLTRVEQVNGRDAEPPEERPAFEDLTAVHPTERLTLPGVLSGIVVGKGSRVAVAGGPGAGATRLLREVATALTGSDGLEVRVVLAGVRPEEVGDWSAEGGATVVGGSFDQPSDPQVQAAELAVEQAKRVAERGGDAVVVIDTLEALPAGAARRLFGAARKLSEGGSVTVIAATGRAWEPQRQANTRIALDSPAADGTPVVSTEHSGTLRAELLG